jgi:rod shape-determining protein MreD
MGSAVISALGSRWNFGHVLPDFLVMVIAFLAMRYEPRVFAVVAAILGYLLDRQALAPIGLHSSALIVCGLAIYLIVGQLVQSGAFFFAWTCFLATMGFHLALFFLAYTGMGVAHFSSWATAMLLPNAAATFLAALALHPLMHRLDALLAQKKRSEGLSWQ